VAVVVVVVAAGVALEQLQKSAVVEVMIAVAAV